MKKIKPIIAISGILVIIGIGISIYESQVVTENIANQQQELSVGSTMTITKTLDPIMNRLGIYSVQLKDFTNNDNIKVTIFDPHDEIIISKPVTKSSLQDNFTISSAGTYKIQIENQGQKPIQVLGIIGAYPQNTLFLDVSGFIFLIVGLSGLAIGIMYFIKNHGKENLS